MKNEIVPTEILADIPFRLDAGNLMSRVHMEPGSEDEEELCALLVRARERARPKAAYRLCFIEARGEDSVTIEGVRFRSGAMRMNLADTERVFAYVATCGHELDELQLPAGDMLAEFSLDSIKTVLLGASIAHLVGHLKKRFGLGATASMSPGSGDAAIWPIEQQRGLFSLLDPSPATIGVELTSCFLMVPNKTVSGIRFETDSNYRACQLCRREPCPNRGAPFDTNLWEKVETRETRNSGSG